MLNYTKTKHKLPNTKQPRLGLSRIVDWRQNQNVALRHFSIVPVYHSNTWAHNILEKKTEKKNISSGF